MSKSSFTTLAVMISFVLLSACDNAVNISSSQTGATNTELANPSDQNCIDVGGSIENKEDSQGNSYAVCVFEDNRQCEAWALMRGECPVGGVKITGYDNGGQILCAIRGGEVDMENAMCTLPDQRMCMINETDITCPEVMDRFDAE